MPTLTNDTRAQQEYMATGSMSWYYAGYEGCGGANTTRTTNSNAFVGSSTQADLLAKYELPFGVQVPMDGYGGCGAWATDALNQFPDLLAYSTTGPSCAGSVGRYSCTNSWVRVDDMNLAKQIYNDLVAVKNTLLIDNAGALRYWNAIYVSSIGSDGGTGPGDQYGQDEIWHFARSAYCSTYFGSTNCNTLAGEVSDIQAVSSSTAYNFLTGGTFGNPSTQVTDGVGYGDYVDSLYLLGLTYASYNFSQKYNVGHPFVVLPGKPSYTCFASPSLYPYPYNTTYIEGLNLCQYEIHGTATVENGGGTSPLTISADKGICLTSSNSARIPGSFLVDMVAAGPAASVSTERNMFYYTALCAATVVQSPGYGGPANWGSYPSNPYFWSIQPAFANILNRMLNVGYHQYPKVTIGGATSSTTNVTLLGGPGVPLLAWFYTNRTGGDTASVSLTASAYHLSSSWCAVSMLTMAVISCAGGSTISLTNMPIPSSSYPAWNPIYIFNMTSPSLQNVLYTNMISTAASINSSALLASFNGPHTASGWMLAYDSQVPTRVVNNRTGSLPQYPSLASLNKTLIGENYLGGRWQNYTQQGWFYDSTNHIVYVHYEMGSPVQIIVNNQGSGAYLGADGSASGCDSGGRSYTLTALTTSSTNDILVVGTTILSSSITVTGVTDTAGLSWSARSGHVTSGSGAQATDTEEWYAKSVSTLSIDTITVTLTGTASACSNAFAVKAANFTSPFDSNGGLPSQSVAPSLSISTPVSIGATSSASIGQVTGGENSKKFFHAGGNFLAFYESSSGSTIYYQSCHDNNDCTQASNWSPGALFFSGTAQPASEEFSLFYDYTSNVVYSVVLLGGNSVGWFSGTVSGGFITTSPSSPTQSNVHIFSTTFSQVINSDPQIILDKSGDLIFGIATASIGAGHIEVWRCAGSSSSCVPSNIHTLTLGSPPAASLPTLFALANGGIALTYSSGNYNYPTPVSYTSCPSTCSGDSSWSSPVATSGNYLPGSCIQNAAFISSDTVYCASDAASTSPTTFLAFTYGGASWTQNIIDSATATMEGISTDGNGGFVITYCVSSSTCYYQSSSNSGSTWTGAQGLTTAGYGLQSGSLQAPELIQSSDGGSVDFIIAGGSESSNIIYYARIINPFTSVPSVSSVPTSNPIDLIFGISGYFGSSVQTIGTLGGLSISSISLGNGGTAPTIAIEYAVTRSMISSARCSFGTPVYSWAIICDAIQGLAGSVTSTTSTSVKTSSTTSTAASSTSSSSTSLTTSTSTFLSSTSSSSSSSTLSTSSGPVTTTVTTTATSATTSTAKTSSSTSVQTTTIKQAIGFHLDLASSSGSILVGQGTKTVVSVVLEGGPPQQVGLSATGVPSGVSVSFAPPAGIASFASTMLLDSTGSVAPGNYQIDVIGTSGSGLTRSVAFQLSIQTPAGYAVTLSPPSATGGTTEPPAGKYTFAAGKIVTVAALASAGWSFDHWVVNSKLAGNGTGLSFTLGRNMEITPVFIHVPVTNTPIASVSFSSKGESSSGIMVDGAQYSLPTSFSWAIGSTHTASVQSVISAGNDSKLVLIGWQGGRNSSSSMLSFTVKGSMTEIAAYQTRYLANFIFLDSTGIVVTPQDATFLGPEGLLTVSWPDSSGWFGAGVSYTLVGATIDGVSITPLPSYGPVKVTQPGTVTIPLSMYPVSIKVVDVFRQPVSGASVTLTTEGGRVFTQVTGKNGSAAFGDIPLGSFSASYSYLGVSGSISSHAAGPHNDTVVLVLSYPFVAVVVIFVAVFAIAIVRKRRAAGEPMEYDTAY